MGSADADNTRTLRAPPSPAARSCTGASWVLTPAIVAALGLVSVGLLVVAIRLNDDQAASVAVADVLAQLRNRLSTSHLWLEEAAAGGEKSKVEADLADLARLADLVAFGGWNDSGRWVVPSRDPELARDGKELWGMVAQWRAIAAHSLEDLAIAGEGSELERYADEVFEALQTRATAMEKGLRAGYARRAAGTKALLLTLMVIWCGIVAATTAVVWVRERRRLTVERQLASTTLELERRVDARTLVLQELNGQLLTAQETERRRVATELHDALGHTLVLAKLCVAGAQAEPGGKSGSSAALTELATMLDQAIDETHRLAHDLRPATLENLGLTAALRLLSENGVTHGGAQVEAHIDEVDDAIPAAAHVVVYRIMQEALTNVTKHAHATRVSILVRRHPGLLEATVEDDGPGFDLAGLQRPGKHGGFGLATMKERARLLGGALAVTSDVGRGTRVHLEVPSMGAAVRS